MVNFDVIVVGAGTAGSYASYLLAKAGGLNVALIEMKRRDKVFKTTGDAIGIHHIERMAIKPPSDVFMIKYEGAELFSQTYRLNTWCLVGGVSAWTWLGGLSG